MFLKLNNDKVNIKGRGWVDGRNHRNCLSKEDTTSPTMSNEGLTLSCMIGTMEGQHLATADIPGESLKTDYNKRDIHINMEELTGTLLNDINTAYYKDLIYLDIRGRK